MSEQSFEDILAQKGSFLWKTVGGSMRPLIVQGRDLIYIRRIDRPLKRYDVVLFKRPPHAAGSTYILHRILKRNPDGTYWIVGDSCCSGETVPEESIIGVLSTLVRRGKTVSPDSILYRLYVQLWCGLYPVRFFALRCGQSAKRLWHTLKRS